MPMHDPNGQTRSWTRRRIPTSIGAGRLRSHGRKHRRHHGVSGGSVHFRGRVFRVLLRYGQGDQQRSGPGGWPGEQVERAEPDCSAEDNPVESGAGAGATGEADAAVPDAAAGDRTTAIRTWPICTSARICCWTTTAGSIRSKGTVRIPIARAMELTAQRGLPVAPAASSIRR